MQRIVLHHVEGPRLGQADTYQQPAINVGRAAECHLAFPTERGVSTHHARIEQRDGGFELVDNHSTNGTFINDERIERQNLKAGDLVRFGAFGPVVKIDLPDHVVAAPAPAPLPPPPAFAATMAMSAADLNNAKNAMGIQTPPPTKAAEPPRAPTPRVSIATVEVAPVDVLDSDLFEDNTPSAPPPMGAPPMSSAPQMAPPMPSAPPMPGAPAAPPTGGRPTAPPPPRPASPPQPGVMSIPERAAPPVKTVQTGSGSGWKIWAILGGALVLGVGVAVLLFLKFKH